MSNIGNKETMAKNLAFYLEKSGKTQKEMAELVGVATSTFNDWMKAKKYPRIDKIELLANYFGILKSDLIEEKVTPEMEKNSDIMVDVTVRLVEDIDFRNVVLRNMYDDDFLSLSKMLRDLNEDQVVSVKQMLGSFFK